MLNQKYPRDLIMIGAIFGLATAAWSGWAQESPPDKTFWPVVLGVISIGGLVLLGFSIPKAIKAWHAPTAIARKSRSFAYYLVTFWGEFAIAAVLVVLALNWGRSDLVAPLVLGVVGVHFFALAIVFKQAVLHVAGTFLTLVAIASVFWLERFASTSFWCGLLAALVFLAIGLVCLISGARSRKLAVGDSE